MNAEAIELNATAERPDGPPLEGVGVSSAQCHQGEQR